jgi:hypothetical protein
LLFARSSLSPSVSISTNAHIPLFAALCPGANDWEWRLAAIVHQLARVRQLGLTACMSWYKTVVQTLINGQKVVAAKLLILNS